MAATLAPTVYNINKFPSIASESAEHEQLHSSQRAAQRRTSSPTVSSALRASFVGIRRRLVRAKGRAFCPFLWNTDFPRRANDHCCSLDWHQCLQAAYAAPLILLAQTRQADRDKVNADSDARHREDLALANEQRQLQAARQTDQLVALVEQNTKLTEITKQMSERIEALTREVHNRLEQKSTKP
jgi:hypothetical protein